MAIEKTIILKADMKEALDRLGAVEKSLEDINDTTKKTEKSTGSLATGFKGVGLAMKAAGFALIMKLVDSVTEALMKNQEIADTVETVFNSIGLVFKMVSDTLIDVVKSVTESTENFDAMQKVVSNLMDLALTPFKLAFDSIKLGVQALQLVWEKSIFGGKGKDKERIAELTLSIEATKQSLKDTAIEAVESGKAIATNLVEAVGEVVTIAGKTTEAFKETFEGITINSIIEQGKAITETKKNYELLALAQQRLVEQYDLEAETQRGIRDDIRLSIEERIAANNELGAVLQRQSEAEKAAIQSQIDSVIQLEELEGKTNETKAERFALETELLAIDAKVKGFQAEQLTNEAALQDERITNLQELSDIGKTELDKQINNIEIQAEKKRELAIRTISDAEELQATLIAIDKDASKQKKDIEEDLKKMQLDGAMNIMNSLAAIGQQKLTNEQNALQKQLDQGLISQEEFDKESAKIERESIKREKRNAMMKILIDTAQGVAGAIKAGAGIPFPANLGAIISGVAAVLAGIASAKATLGKVSGGGGGGDGGGDTPEIENAISDSQQGGIGGAAMSLLPDIGITNEGQQSLQAYVVENDISSSQALQEELEIQATL